MKRNNIILFCIILLELLVIISLVKNVSISQILSYFFDFSVDNKHQIPVITPANKFYYKSNNSKLIWELIPSIEAKFDGDVVRLPYITTIKINSDGFRDKEYSIEKPNNTFRIIVLGDSLTLGAGVELDNTYPKLLERKLNSLSNGISYEVFNFGVPGYNTQQEVEMLKVKGLKYEPDMVIVGYHNDDIQNHTRIDEIRQRIVVEEFNLSIEEYPRISYDKQVKINMLAIAEFFTEVNEESWKNIYMSFSELSLLSEKYGFKLLLVTPGFGIQKDHVGKIYEISNENGWNVIIMDDIYRQYDVSSIILHYPLDYHLNKFGHELVADTIYNFLIRNNLINN